MYIHEARGHGRTAGDVHSPDYKRKAGDIGDDGFHTMAEDIYNLSRIVKEEWPELPLFILGHSMGSIVAQLYAAKYGDDVDGLVLTGVPSAFPSDQLLHIVYEEIKTNGPGAPSQAAFYELFKDVNKPFEPVKTELDWITRDHELIQESLALPYTYVLFNNRFYRDFLLAVKETQDPLTIGKIPKSLPVFFLSGDQDVVTRNGAGVVETSGLYRRQGIENAEYKLYREARHSLLRELNRNEIADDILEWITSKITQ